MALPNAHPVIDSDPPEAHEIVRQLDEALARHDITLPSLGVDTWRSSLIADHSPLIELGRCNQDTARALINALAARHGGEAER